MPRIWPVIHVVDAERALQNAALAEAAGAHGVFLIQMDGEDRRLDPIGQEIARRHPRLRVGVNYLSLKAPAAVGRAIANGYSASWSDSPGVRSDGVSDGARAIAAVLAENPDHAFFASVAFKYQPEDADPGEAARLTIALGMAPTTSGPVTGHAPEMGKLRAIREVIGGYNKLALASGVAPENVGMFAPYLTDILISTGISKNFHEFEPSRLYAMVAAAG